jgi:hypothetical protein
MSSVHTGVTFVSLAAVVALSLTDAFAAEKLQLRKLRTGEEAVLDRPPVLHGAGTILPDLVIVSVLPEPDPIEGLPNQGYCYKWPVGGPADRLLFAVRNNGTVPAPATTARVTFRGVTSVETPVVALQPGEQRDIEVLIPDECYPPTAHGACRFVIYADMPHSVLESNEYNSVESRCLLAGT